MPTIAPDCSARHRAALLACWAVVAAGGASLVGWLAQVWSANPDTADRALIVPAAAWLMYRRRADLRRPPAPDARGLLLVAPAALLAVPSWYLALQMGPRNFLLWWLAVLWLAAVAGLILVQSGVHRLRVLAFPLMFLLFALPLPASVRRPLQDFLQEVTTTIAAAVLPVLGVPVERAGYVLHLPSADLGVVEACSGVRSVTAIVAVAALVAHVRGFGLARGSLLVLLALPVVALANTVRVILNGVLQEWLGPWVNQGVAHEALGIGSLLLALWGVLTVSKILRPRGHQPATPAELPPVSVTPAATGAVGVSAVLLSLALVVVSGAAWLIADAAPPAVTDARLSAIGLRVGQWQGEDLPIDAELRSLLAADQVLYRTYRNPEGQPVYVWVIYYSAASAVRDYVHHPDVCWPSRGWTAVGTDRWPIPLPAPAELTLTVRRFERADKQQIVGYWVQDGPSVWSEEDVRRALAPLPTWEEIRERLTGRRPLERTARLSVLVGADRWDTSGYTEKSLRDFIREFTADVYRVCPWALPAPTPASQID